MVEYFKFLFSPTGNALSRRQFWSAIWILATLQCYVMSRGIIVYLQTVVRGSLDSSYESIFLFPWMISNIWRNLFVCPLPVELIILFCALGLVFRMLGSRGVKSCTLKLFLGICVFISIRIPSFVLFYISSKDLLEKFNQHFYRNMEYFITGIGVLYLLAFIGFVAVIVLGLARGETGDDPFNRPNPRVPLERQLGRVDFIMGYIKLSLCSLVAVLVLSGVVFVLGYGRHNHFHGVFITGGLLGVLIMIWVINLMVKRLRNMGKSALKYLGLFYTAVVLASIAAYFCIYHGNVVLVYCGECINQAVMSVGYFFFFYLSFAPHNESPSDRTGDLTAHSERPVAGTGVHVDHE